MEMDEYKINEKVTKSEDTEAEKKEEKRFKWKKDQIILAIIFSLIVVVSIALLGIMIWDKNFLFELIRNWFIKPIVELPFGTYTRVTLQILIFLCLMVLQSLLVPIPSELILLVGGILFGWWGILIGVIGSLFSAAVTYYLSKRGGRAIVDASGERVGIIKRTIYIFDIWIQRWGLWAILVGRAVPVIMFDPISYAAGLAKIKDWHYFLATFIGSIPRAVFYVFFGIQLLSEYTLEEILVLPAADIDAVAGQFNTYFFIIFGVLVFMFILSNVIYYLRKRKEKMEAEEKKEGEEVEDNSQSTNEIN
ncbi:MAG: VTT domain-containing protein [Asgard group archaeon]|nr:VTT domain-containing protein [Asgard group archaeon]